MAKLNKTQRAFLLAELSEKSTDLSDLVARKRGERDVRTLQDYRRGDDKMTLSEVLGMISKGIFVPKPTTNNENEETFEAYSELEAFLIHKDDVKNVAYNTETDKTLEMLRQKTRAQCKKVERDLLFAETDGVDEIVESFNKFLTVLAKSI